MADSEACRGGSRTAATSKMDLFVIIVNYWKSSTINIKSSILDVAAVLDPALACNCTKNGPFHSHLPRILLWSWVIIYDYFKSLRTTFFSRILLNGRFNTLRVFDTVMLSLRTLTKYSLTGTLSMASSQTLAQNLPEALSEHKRYQK